MDILFGGIYLVYNYLDFDLPDNLDNAIDRVCYTLKWHGLTIALVSYMIDVKPYSSQTLERLF
jgi:hypothetical protein